jgi:hypothetical protein
MAEIEANTPWKALLHRRYLIKRQHAHPFVGREAHAFRALSKRSGLI